MTTEKIVWKNEFADDTKDEAFIVEADMYYGKSGDWAGNQYLFRPDGMPWMVLGSASTLDEAMKIAVEWEDDFFDNGLGGVGIRIRRVRQ